MFTNEPGIYAAPSTISLAPATILDDSGDLQVLIADSFDYSGIDGVCLAGSFLEIN